MLELDETGLLEWRVYELEGRLAAIAYDATKEAAVRRPDRRCLDCSGRTERAQQICLKCEHRAGAA